MSNIYMGCGEVTTTPTPNPSRDPHHQGVSEVRRKVLQKAKELYRRCMDLEIEILKTVRVQINSKEYYVSLRFIKNKKKGIIYCHGRGKDKWRAALLVLDILENILKIREELLREINNNNVNKQVIMEDIREEIEEALKDLKLNI